MGPAAVRWEAMVLALLWAPIHALTTPSRRAILAQSGAAAFFPGAAAAYDSKAYDGYAPTYDALDGGAAAGLLGLKDARAALLARATGRVLEVGAGTLLNAPYYERNPSIVAVDAVDASSGMVDEARKKSRDPRIRAFVADAARLDFAADGAYDTAVDTFCLCVYEDPVAVLRELRRVVKRDGRVLLLENARPRNALLGAYTDATAAFVADHGGKGCRYDQDVAALARAAGLAVEAETPYAGGTFRAFVLRPA